MLWKKLLFTPVVTALIGLFIFFIGLPTACAHQEVGLQIAGEIIQTDPAPFIDNNRVMVPVREVTSALKADVSWNEEKRAVEVVQGEYQITMYIGKLQGIVNGKDVQLEASPVIVDDRAMVPVRILAEGLQVPVSWDNNTRVVSLDKLALVVGSSLVFPPFEFKDGNEPVGFDIDLIKAIEEVSGEKIIVKDTRFNQLIPSLCSGKIDLIISGLSIVEQCKQVIDFTMSYFDWGEIILSLKGGTSDIVLEDLAGKKIAVQGGSKAHNLAGELEQKHPNTQLRIYESLEEVWTAIEKGEVDAGVVSYALTAYYLTNHEESKIRMVGKVFASQPIGIAVQKGNKELLEKLNKSLQTIKENGTYDRLYEKWFGTRVLLESGN